MFMNVKMKELSYLSSLSFEHFAVRNKYSALML